MTTVTRNTPLIHSETGDYPVYLDNLVKYAPNTSFPQTVDSDTLIDFGLEVVHQTEAPQGDVVTEGTPELKSGEWYQTWVTRSYNEIEEAQKLQSQKDYLQSNAEVLHAELFGKGFPYRFPNGDVYHVQVRATDRSNISDLRTIAKEYIAEGQDVTFDFRTYENISVTLTAAEMVEMANVTFTQVQGGYKAIWAYKDAIATATTLADLPATPVDIFSAAASK